MISVSVPVVAPQDNKHTPRIEGGLTWRVSIMYERFNTSWPEVFCTHDKIRTNQMQLGLITTYN